VWKIASIDADSLVYAAGFGSQGEPESHCFHLLNRSLDSIKRNVPADEYHVYITGPGNYRDSVPTYKANRTAERPQHYVAAREFLMEHHDAELVVGMEADDAVSIAQTQLGEEHIIVSIDKDLLQVPGWHYSWKRKKNPTMYVTELHGAWNFYHQMLAGDAVDNIKGLPWCTESVVQKYCLSAHALRGCGAKSADSVLSGSSSPAQLYEHVKYCYDEYYNETGEDLLELNAHLLWMTRELDHEQNPVPWSPPV
jgi:5'-3' exonuclease